MTNSGNPFTDYNFGQFADPTKFFESFGRVPGFDPTPFVEAQRRNIEAIVNANRIAAEGVQAVMRRQADILRQTMEESMATMRQLSEAGAPEDKAVQQLQTAKAAFEKTLQNLRELAEMTAKSNGEAMDLINKRLTESFDEFKAVMEKVSAEAKTAKF